MRQIRALHKWPSVRSCARLPSGRCPLGVFVQRVNRARQTFPVKPAEHGRGEPRGVDFVYIPGWEPGREASPEVAARLHDDRARSRDIQPDHLEEHRVGRPQPFAEDRASDLDRARGLYDGLVTRMEGMAGVQSAGLTAWLPLREQAPALPTKASRLILGSCT